MQLLKFAILGIVQGLTEFLPVSSSGHLAIFHRILGVEADLGFDTAVHIGTGLAVLIYYFPKLWGYVSDILAGLITGRGRRKGSGEGAKIALLLIATSVPAALAGVFLEDSIEAAFASPWAVSAFLCVTGIILIAAGRSSGGKVSGPAGMTYKVALLIGIAQAVALLPGISRSGMTLSAGLFLGLAASWAVDYSMLASLPVIFGAFLVQALKDGGLGGVHGFEGIAIGVVVSLATGLLAISLLKRLAARRNLVPFAAWVFIAAAANIAIHSLWGI